MTLGMRPEGCLGTLCPAFCSTHCLTSGLVRAYAHHQRRTMARPTKKETDLLMDFACTTMQSFWRMMLAKFYVRSFARQFYEKLLDTKRQAYYYFNNITGEASWYKPKFMGTDDFDLQENYDFYQSEQYMFSPYKINKYLKGVESKTYENDVYDDYDDAMDDDDYQVYKVDNAKIDCIDYNVPKRSGEEGGEEETAVQRLLRVEREHQAIEEEERRLAMEAKRTEKAKMLEDKKKVVPLYVRYDFQRDFGAPLYQFEHHIYDPPLKANEFTVLAMRKRGMRLRKSQKLRTTRVKECTILPCLDEGMLTDDPYIARRAIAMCMHLKSQVGLHFMGYSVLRGLVACRQRLKYLLDLIDEPDDADNFATAPPTKPWPLHDEYLENMTEIPEIRSKDWYKFTLRQLNVLKQRIGLRPEEWEEKLGPTPLRKEPSFLAVCWSKYALELKSKRLKDLAERHDERIMKITSTSRSTGSSTKENEDLDMTAKDLDPLYVSDDSSSDAQENLLVKESEYIAQARAEADSRGAKVDKNRKWSS